MEMKQFQKCGCRLLTHRPYPSFPVVQGELPQSSVNCLATLLQFLSRSVQCMNEDLFYAKKLLKKEQPVCLHT